ncbi:MAG: nuclear transport factor 2 family protein [Caulobacteraceae bacterium]
MRTIAATIVFAALLALSPLAANAASPESEITVQTRRFLDAYALGDQITVLSDVSPDVSVYGGDIAEMFNGVAGVRRMMEGDQKLWGGSAKIGAIQNQSIVCAPKLCATTFEAPFSLGSSAPIRVRFSMVWRRTAKGWRLAQSANSTPTVGQSAEALPRR